MDEWYYDEHDLYHGDAHNLSGLRPWESDVVGTYFEQCRSILVGSAGGGLEVIALQRRGYDADGFECHEGLVETANRLLATRRVETERCPRGPRPSARSSTDSTTERSSGGTGTRSSSPGHAGSSSSKPSGVSSFLDGPVLVSFFYRDSVTAYLRVVATLGSSLRRLRRRDHVQIGDNLEPNFVHYFSPRRDRFRARSGGLRNGLLLEPKGVRKRSGFVSHDPR